MLYFFHPAAEAEYLESIAFYESKQAGLGASFFTEFESKMNVVVSSPELYPVKIDDIHKAPLDRFPFSILYRISKGNVQVLVAAHDRRRPSYWLGRI